MTELGDVIVKPLIAIGTIKFYNCFVDDTLLVMKPENISEVYNAFNKFDKNLGSTLNMSQNEVPYFLDLELSPGITFFFWQDNKTGAYLNFTSFVPWTYRTSWTRVLLHMHPIYAQQIHSCLKSTTLKDLLSGMIFLNQLSIQ